MHKMIVPLILAMLGLCLMIDSSSASATEIIAHRGASFYAPENTLASFKLAWQMKADAAELDIHLSKDGKIFVIHDASTARTTGKDLSIKDSNSSEIRALDAGSYKGKEFENERIPYLEEALATIPRGRRMFVEIKCGQEVLPALQNAIKASRKERQIRIIGFDLDTIAAFKKLMQKIPVYWLQSKGNTDSYNMQLIESARSRGIDGLDLNNTGLDKEFADAAKAAGLKLYVWTVDDPVEAKRLVSLGVDGITTNRPDLIREKGL